MSDNRSRVRITHEDGWWKVYIVGGPHLPDDHEPMFVGRHPTREDAVAHVGHMNWEIEG